MHEKSDMTLAGVTNNVEKKETNRKKLCLCEQNIIYSADYDYTHQILGSKIL